MTSETSSYRNLLLTALADPLEATAYLNAAYEDSVQCFEKARDNINRALERQRNVERITEK